MPGFYDKLKFGHCFLKVGSSMKKIVHWLRALDGATAIEYSLLIAGIAMILTVVAFLLGDEIEALFTALIAGMQQ